MEALNVTGVSESVVEHLRTQIIAGNLTPGQKLNELELSSRLGISRPPLREAFRVLENDHLVKSIPRKGTYVSDLSSEDLREVYKAREMIECYAIDILGARNITNIANVTSSLESVSHLSLPPQDDKEKMMEYVQSFTNFHLELVRASGNKWLFHFYDLIRYSLARYQFLSSIYGAGLTNKSFEEHRQILGGIERGDYAWAKEALLTHIRYTLAIIEEGINKAEI